MSFIYSLGDSCSNGNTNAARNLLDAIDEEMGMRCIHLIYKYLYVRINQYYIHLFDVQT